MARVVIFLPKTVVKALLVRRKVIAFGMDFILLAFIFFFSSQDFRALSVDHCEILHRHRKYVRFYNLHAKFCGPPPKKILGQKTCKISDYFKL